MAGKNLSKQWTLSSLLIPFHLSKEFYLQNVVLKSQTFLCQNKYLLSLLNLDRLQKNCFKCMNLFSGKNPSHFLLLTFIQIYPLCLMILLDECIQQFSVPRTYLQIKYLKQINAVRSVGLIPLVNCKNQILLFQLSVLKLYQSLLSFLFMLATWYNITNYHLRKYQLSETRSEPCQTSKTEVLQKWFSISSQLSIIFTQRYISMIWQGAEYASNYTEIEGHS